MFGPVDNDYVQLCTVNGEVLGFTDSAAVSSFSPEDLSTSPVDFDDSLIPRLAYGSSVAHVVKDYASGGVIGLAQVSPYTGGAPYASVYRQSKSETSGKQERVEIARVPMQTAPYSHSFGFSGSHAVVCEHQWTLDSGSLFKGEKFMEASRLGSNYTRLHLVEIETGEVTVFDAPEPFFGIHFANVREAVLDDGSLVVEFVMPTWTSPEGGGGSGGAKEVCNPYAVFDFFRVEDEALRDSFNEVCGNKLKKHTLFKTGPRAGEAAVQTLDSGWFEYPHFNWHMRGEATCFTYLTQFYADGTGVFGSMAIVKFDQCKGERVATFSEGSTFVSEPHFIARDPSHPYTAGEDDGVIITTIMDGASEGKLSTLLILDAADLSVIARLPLERSVPATVHGWFVTKEEEI